MLDTPEGREVLSFLISCAMPDDETLEATYDGTTYEFFGELGLAPRWERRPLDRKGKGWVSACLFARVNANNVTIPVSLRGPHNQLTATADEKAGWTLEEGAFYGNYFTDPDDPIDWVACRGRDQATAEAGGLLERDCAEPDPANPGRTICGFKFAGDCGTFATTTTKPACKKFSTSGTYYKDCVDEAKPLHHKRGGHHHDDDDDDNHHDDDDDNHHDDDDDCNGHHGWNKRYREVITTYVIP